MAPTIMTGLEATKGPTNPINPTQIVPDILKQVFEIDPNANPALTLLTNRAPKSTVTQPQIQWFEDEPLPSWDTTTGTVTNSATTVPVTNGTYWRGADLLLVPRTGETVRVVSVSSNNLTVTRAWAGSGTAMNSGEQLLRVGAAEMEGDVSPAAKSTVTVTKSNYTQIIRTPVHVSGTLDATTLYTGNERTRQRRKAAAEHARRWEETFFHGRKKEDVTNFTNPLRSCGGVDEYISTNALSAGGTMTESEFTDFLGDSMRFSVNQGNTNKVLFASREVLQTIESWGKSKLQMRPTDTTYGIHVQTYLSTLGKVDLVNHPLLETGYAGYAYLLDMAGIGIHALTGRDMRLKTNIQAPDSDAFKDEYLAEMTFSFGLEKAHAKISGVTF